MDFLHTLASFFLSLNGIDMVERRPNERGSKSGDQRQKMARNKYNEKGCVSLSLTLKRRTSKLTKTLYCGSSTDTKGWEPLAVYYGKLEHRLSVMFYLSGSGGDLMHEGYPT